MDRPTASAFSMVVGMQLRVIAGILGIALAGFRAAGADLPPATVFMFCGNTPTAAPAAADTDGDGLADDWEATHGLNPLMTDDASLDHDGDGLDARQEALAGSDPWLVDSDDDGLVDARDPAPTVALVTATGCDGLLAAGDAVNVLALCIFRPGS